MSKSREHKWKWSKRHRCSVRPTELPGIFERRTREGTIEGFAIRTRVVERATGRVREIKRVMASATLGEARVWLEEETDRVRGGTPRD